MKKQNWILKEARKWYELNGREQREYLKRHPRSKRKVNKPLRGPMKYRMTPE